MTAVICTRQFARLLDLAHEGVSFFSLRLVQLCERYGLVIPRVGLIATRRHDAKQYSR